ncbi:MAG: hypothetical protein ACLVBP_13525 [Ruminococcus sp.]
MDPFIRYSFFKKQKNVSFNTQKLREKLPEFLAGLDGNFDAMIITGDFRYAPEKKIILRR